MIQPSTFSIVAYDANSQSWGVAVASKFPAVGAIVPWASANSGAIATQAHANTSFGQKGLELLARGFSAEQTFNILRLSDEGIEHRQIGLVDRSGGSFTFTGKECFDWAGGVAGNGYAIQGNILAGAQVVAAMQSIYLNTAGPLTSRLIASLKAGDDAGGDKRGKQSAAILVVKEKAGYSGFNDKLLDYRVDDAQEPIGQLIEMLNYHELLFGKSELADKLKIEGEVRHELEKVLRVQLGWEPEAPKEFRSALNEFIGRENFEDRCDLDTIDRPVFEYILRRFLA